MITTRWRWMTRSRTTRRRITRRRTTRTRMTRKRTTRRGRYRGGTTNKGYRLNIFSEFKNHGYSLVKQIDARLTRKKNLTPGRCSRKMLMH